MKTADSFALTCDHWTAHTHEPFFDVTDHFKSKDWMKYDLCLGVNHMPESHTATNSFSRLIENLDEFALVYSTETVALTTDSAANMETFGSSSFIWFKGLGLVLQIAIRDAFKVSAAVRDLLERMHNIASSFNCSILVFRRSISFIFPCDSISQRSS